MEKDGTRLFAIGLLNALYHQARAAQADEPESTDEGLCGSLSCGTKRNA